MQKLINGIIAAALVYVPLCFAQADTIKIAVAGPFSGAYASFGEQLWQGATQARDDINAKGGINGVPITLIQADDACEPKQAITVANRLINEEHVNAVIGHFCSSSTIPASAVYADSQMLMITPASTNPMVTDRNLKTVFRTCGRDDQQGVVGAEFIYKKLKAKNVAVIQDQDTYGKGLADAMKDHIEKLGAHIVLYEGLSRGEKDFNALVTKLKSVSADAVYFGGMHPEGGPLLRQMREQGVMIPFISGDGIVSEDFVTSAGGPSMVKNVYMTFSADPRNMKQVQQLVARFRNKHFEPEGYTIYTYATVQAIAQAIENSHSLKGDVLSDWLHHNKVKTVLGEKSWDHKGDLTDASYEIYRWNNKGKYEPLTQ
jgi:branched-chain amino acid transport system substrate-binding protein